jgi:hypothetical protein
MWILDSFHTVDALEGAPIEDVAFAALQQSKLSRHDGRIFHPGNIVGTLREHYSRSHIPGSTNISPNDVTRILNVALEAFSWLKNELLIADDFGPTGGYGWHFVTRLGESINSHRDLSSYAKKSYLPKGVVLEEISSAAMGSFLGGRFDDAVRSAFTRVESQTRIAAQFGNDQYGAPMMRNAFFAGARDGSKPPGPLADLDLEYPEREGVANLFAGAIGYIKNPLSHREIGIDDARIAASRILLANDLLITLHAHTEKKHARETTEFDEK